MRITKHDSNFNLLRWITGVKVVKSETRLFKRCIEFKDGNATRTNGHILLTARVNDIENGLYEIAKRNKQEIVLLKVDDVEFPDWSDLFNIDKSTCTQLDITCSLVEPNYYGLACISREVEEKFCFNWTLYNIITNIDDVFVVDVQKNGPCCFTNTTNDRRALLMPLTA